MDWGSVLTEKEQRTDATSPLEEAKEEKEKVPRGKMFNSKRADQA
jgi:hypothetical protein